MCTANQDIETLKDLLDAVGLTQREFAKMLGVSRESVRCWSQGLYFPTLDKAAMASKILNCSIERFAMACKIQIWQQENN